MTSEYIALVGLGLTLLASVLASGITVGKMLEIQRELTEKKRDTDQRLSRLDEIPSIRIELEHLKKNYSLFPKMLGDIEVLKTQAQHSKEMRSVMRRSRPDPDEEES